MSKRWFLASLALSVAPVVAAQDTPEVAENWSVEGHEFSELTAEWEITSNDELSGAALRHVVFTPVAALPDSVSHSYLLDAAANVVARWNSVDQERVRAVDLDADGTAEIVRDIALPAPCGIFAWREPAVLEEDEFMLIAIGAPISSQRNLGRAGSPPANVLSEAFDSSDRYLDDSSLLTDGDPATAWEIGGGRGAWVALRAPEGARIGGVRLSSDEGDSPVVVSVRFGDGATQVLEVDGQHREYAVRTESRCAVVTVSDLGGREQLVLTEASLVASTDGLQPSELVETFWGPALVAACNADRDPSEMADALSSASAEAAAQTLLTSDDSCVTASLASSLEQHDGAGELRLVFPMTDAAAAALQNGEFSLEAVPRLAELSEEDPAWMTALERTVAGHSGLQLDSLFRAVDEQRFEGALSLAPASIAVPLHDMLADDSPDSWIRALRIALAFETPVAAEDTLRSALAHDNGTVARLGIALVSAVDAVELEGDIQSIAGSDPSSVLRAAAVAALSDMGHPVVDEHYADRAPDVRAAVAGLPAATRWLVEDSTRVDVVLATETWPEVRSAWLQAASRAGSAAVDSSVLAWLIDAGTEDDIATFFLAMRVRAGSVPPAAIDLMMARDDSRTVLQAGLGVLRYAEVLPREWLESLTEVAGYSEQMAPVVEALLD